MFSKELIACLNSTGIHPNSPDVAIVVHPARTLLLVKLNPAVETGNRFGSTGNPQLSHHGVLKAAAVQDGRGGAGAGVKVKPQVVKLGLEVGLAANSTYN